jgi:hypothetical protein
MIIRGRRGARMAVLLAVAGATGTAGAEPQRLRLGAVEIGYDDREWTVHPLGVDEVGLRPIGETAEKRDPIRAVRMAGTDCEAVAARYLPDDLYEPPMESRDQFAGQPAQRFETRSRCRNATPIASLLCLRLGPDAVALVATIPSCQSRSNRLFQSDEPFASLSARVRFGE